MINNIEREINLISKQVENIREVVLNTNNTDLIKLSNLLEYKIKDFKHNLNIKNKDAETLGKIVLIKSIISSHKLDGYYVKCPISNVIYLNIDNGQLVADYTQELYLYALKKEYVNKLYDELVNKIKEVQ